MPSHVINKFIINPLQLLRSYLAAKGQERKKERKKECIFILFTPNNDKN
jgi:hypothetical protein